MSETTHDNLIRDQFTRQATVFNTAAPIAAEAALQKIVDAASPQPGDSVLDVACGGGSSPPRSRRACATRPGST